MARVDIAKSSSRLVQVAAVIVIIWALRYAQEVLVPIALAVLLSFLLAPLVHRLERFKLGRVTSALMVVVVAFAFLGGLGYVIAGQVIQLEKDLPNYRNNIQEKVVFFKSKIGGLSNASNIIKNISKEMSSSQPSSQPAIAERGPQTGVQSWIDRALPPPPPAVQPVTIVSSEPPVLEAAISTIGPTLQVLATAFIIVVLVIFMLIQREDMRDRLIRLVSHGQLSMTTQALEEAATRVSRYLLMQSIINGSYGICVGLGLFFIGVPNAPLWGLLAALFRFIPYVGPWLGAAIPLTLSLAIFHGALRPLLAVGMFVTLEIITSSVLEPWLYGSHTGVSSIAILAAAIFWAWLWGPVGLILSTPLTVLLVVVGKYVPQLEFFGVLLGDEPVFNPQTRYYQRLLALDQEEANEVIEELLTERPLEDVYESVLIPALRMAERDRLRGRLDDEKQLFIRQSMKEEIEEYGEKPPQAPKADDGSPGTAPARINGAEKVRIMILPARDEADEIAGMMLGQILRRAGFEAQAVSVAALASEMVDLVAEQKADIVVISALPPSAITHARYLCKRLHARFTDLPVVIGLWTASGDLKLAARRIASTDQDAAVNTFADAMHEVQQRVHSLILKQEKPSERELAATSGTIT